MTTGKLLAVGRAYWVTTPLVVILSILFPSSTVNQRLPPGPEGMPRGRPPWGSGYSVITPLVVVVPIWLAVVSVNQSRPSFPLVMPLGKLPNVGVRYSVKVPA